MKSIILVMSLMGSVVLLFYWLLRPLAEKYFSVGWKYGMLKVSLILYILPIPVLKSIVMLLVDKGVNRFSFAVSSLVDLEMEQAIQVGNNELMALPMTIPVLMIFTAIWLTGFIAIFCWQIFSYNKARKYMLENAIPLSDRKILDLFEGLKNKVGVKKNVAVFISPNINTPVTMGLFSTVIILPNMSFGADKLGYILEHELVHIKHNDFLLRLGAVFVSGLHWFNPLSYMLMKEIGNVCEYVCDENVVIDLNESQRRVYGHAILDVSAQSILDKGPGKALINSFGNNNKKVMKVRLSNMKSIKRTKRSMRILSGVIGLALTMLSMMTVFAYEEPRHIEGDSIESETIMMTASFSKGDENTQRLVSGTSNQSVKVVEYFVNQEGEMRVITDNMLKDGRALCIHKYEDGEYIKHSLYSGGNCKEEYFNAQMCAYCGRVVVGTKFNTITYAVCIH